MIGRQNKPQQGVLEDFEIASYGDAIHSDLSGDSSNVDARTASGKLPHWRT